MHTLGNYRYSLPPGAYAESPPLLRSLSLPTTFPPHPPKNPLPKEAPQLVWLMYSQTKLGALAPREVPQPVARCWELDTI